MIGDTPKRDVFVRKRRDFDAIDVARSTTGSTNDVSFSLQLKTSSIGNDNDYDTSTDSIRCYLSTKHVRDIASYGSVVDELKRYVSGERRLQASSSNASLRPNVGSPSLYRTILIGEAMKFTPMKRVIVSKRHKRNSIVRRTIRNRKLKHSRSNCRRKSRRKFGYLGSPPTSSTSLPDRPSDGSPFSRTPVNVRNRISRSMDSFATRVGKTLSSPLRLIRTKNFDNIARWKDENQNDVSVRCSISKLPSFVSPGNADVPEKPIESSNSQAPVSINHDLFVEDKLMTNIDSANIKNTEDFKPALSKRKVRKRVWKFW
ncbi:uncharacterized protein LOC143186361 [Calliopsis andreniformis]|uniref:uncharacterized protein LOC143186361 n=1 Tax=Calliopsis andreniformis TaxID=337506 RepID=UPI003FCEBF3A